MNSMDDCSEIFALRRRVFVEEMALPPQTEHDAFDEMAYYALVFDASDVPSATGRLALMDDRFTIGRVCVLKSARGQGLGDLVLRMLLVRVQEMEAPVVWVSALTSAASFYARYGFRPFGEAFIEEEREHQMMRALASEIDIEGNCRKREKGCQGCGKSCSDCT